MNESRENGTDGMNVESVPHSEKSYIKTWQANKYFILVLFGLTCFKVWLISSDEIVASFSPHDDLWYAQSAREWYWLGPYAAPFGVPSFIRPCVYPLFVAISSHTGLPLRICTELFFILAALVFIWAIIKAQQPRFLAVLLFTLIIFHPLTFVVNSRLQPDSLYASVLMLALASMIILLMKADHVHRRRYALLTGIILAVLWHVRQESPIIIVLLVIYGLMALLRFGIRKPRAEVAAQLSTLVLVPLLVIGLVSLVVRSLNYAKFGVFAVDAISAPGFEAAGRSLLRIVPQHSFRYVAIPREVRERAYVVSPAFRELQPVLEGPTGRQWATFARTVGVQVDGEISTPHFMWALNKGAHDIGYKKSAREADQYFQRVANEINAACDAGQLQCRWAFSSVLDPNVKNYLPHLPGSLLRVHSQFFISPSVTTTSDPPNLPPVVREVFDNVANRRADLTTDAAFTYLSGWVVHPKEKLQSVVVRDQTGRVLASADQLTPRPDVVSAFAAKGLKAPLNSGFYLKYPSESTPHTGQHPVVFIAESGTESVVPRSKRASGIDGSQALFYAIDSDRTVRARPTLKLRVKNLISVIYGRLNIVLAYLAIVSVLVLLFRLKSIDRRNMVYSIITLLAAAVVIRLLLLTLIDASSYLISAPRYIFPVTYLYTCTLLLLNAQGIREAIAWRQRHKILQTVSSQTNPRPERSNLEK